MPAAKNGQPGTALVEGWYKPASNRGITQAFRPEDEPSKEIWVAGEPRTVQVQVEK